jgi:hypothetical protein
MLLKLAIDKRFFKPIILIVTGYGIGNGNGYGSGYNNIISGFFFIKFQLELYEDHH